MMTPTFSTKKSGKDGKPAVELIVRNATPELRELLDSLGYKADCTIANRRSIICTTTEEIDAARKPLMALFDRAGNWIGK